MGTDLGEVQLETTRTSRTYRARLEQTLGLLLHWISFSAWCGVDWWLCPVKVNQVLVEFVEWQFTTGARICHSRHAILIVHAAFRDLRGHLGRSWECLQRWQLKLPLQSRRPIRAAMVNGMFLVGIAQGLLSGPRALVFWVAAIIC